MDGETIIAAGLGLLSGAGGLRFLARMAGPERDEKIADYYRGVIKDLRSENEELRGRLRSLEARISDLEIAQDHPPGHLG